jgi:hypothetical protein
MLYLASGEHSRSKIEKHSDNILLHKTPQLLLPSSHLLIPEHLTDQVSHLKRITQNGELLVYEAKERNELYAAVAIFLGKED